MRLTHSRVIAFAAVTTWFAIDAVRTAGPLLSDLFDIGVEVAAGVGFAMFIAGGLLAAVMTPLMKRTKWALVLLAALATVLRFTLPFLSEDVLIVVGVAMTITALALALSAARLAVVHAGGGALGIAASLGAAVAIVEQVVVRTWDAVWRADGLGWALMIVAGAALVAAAWGVRRLTVETTTRGWWAHGLWLSLTLYALGNIAFVNSQAGVRMSMGSVLIVAGLLAGSYLSSYATAMARTTRIVLVAATVPAAAIVMYAQGAPAAIALPVLAAGATLGMALTVRTREGAPSLGRDLGVGAGWGVAALLPFMLIQLDYDIPLGFPHLLVIVAVTVPLSAVAATRSARTPQRETREPAAASVAAMVGVGVLVLGVGVGTYLKYEQPRAYPADFIAEPTVMSWNLHYGVTPRLGGGPGIDLNEMSAVVADVDPDVLMLQEVNRGWILAGGVDLLEYFAGEYSMEFVYTPAHDYQFGNAIFANRPLTDRQVFQLPYGDGPQRRGVAAADYMGVTYAVVHLQHKQRDDTRVAQVESLLEQLHAPGPVVVAGDFNDVPDSRAVVALFDALFLSAQDQIGQEAVTYIGPDFEARIDYIFGRDATFREFRLLDDVLWSDHLPLVAVITTEQ